jgi:hypothetical protein
MTVRAVRDDVAVTVLHCGACDIVATRTFPLSKAKLKDSGPNSAMMRGQIGFTA